MMFNERPSGGLAKPCRLKAPGEAPDLVSGGFEPVLKATP